MRSAPVRYARVRLSARRGAASGAGWVDERPGGAAEEDLAAAAARTRPDVDDPVRVQDRLVVVFDHEHRVAAVAHPAHHVQQEFRIVMVQADRGLVEHEEHALETDPRERCQPDAPGFASRERRRLAIQREVPQAQALQRLAPLVDLPPDRVEKVPGTFSPGTFVPRDAVSRLVEEPAQVVDRQGRGLRDARPADLHGQRLGPQARAAARPAGHRAHEAQDVGVPLLPEDLLHHGEDALVDALLPRLGGDARPSHPRLERVLAVRDADPIGAVENDIALLRRQRLPREVDRETMRAAHLVEHVDGDLRVDQVAGGRRDPQRAAADGLRRVGDQQVRVEAVFDTQSLAGRAGPVGGVEREQPSFEARAFGTGGHRAQPRPAQPQQVVQLRQRADRRSRVAGYAGLVEGDGREQTGDISRGGPRNSPQELPRVRRERLQVSAASFLGNGVEGERGLAGPRHARDDGKRAVRDADVHPLQVVFVRACHDDGVEGGARGVLSRHGCRTPPLTEHPMIPAAAADLTNRL